MKGKKTKKREKKKGLCGSHLTYFKIRKRNSVTNK